ncbi:MAG: lipopolysaccharide kinase InaA family protein [Thermoguttaceae bacterium]|nr:lipopolysaccharide kinase InaA family protein [Thermoguttaceae bacterium]MDW8039369.1 lipopolysaccharide kinase InaA family protein [Thermoguttaceae bacterium]
MDEWIERKEGKWYWKILGEWESVLLGTGGWPLECWSRRYPVESVKQGLHRAVYRVQTPKGAIYVKHYRAPRWTDSWRNFFRGCPARREFQTLLAIAERGVSTLRPIGWAKPFGLRGLWDSLLVTEAIPNAVSLDEYFQSRWPKVSPADQPRTMRCLLRELAVFLAQCHQAGIQHGDLHTGNILVVADPIGGQQETDSCLKFQFFLIDVQAVRVGKPLSRPTTLHNLAQLAGAWRERTTPTQRWYFWKHYCQARPQVAFDLREDAERIDRLGFEHRLRIYRHWDRRLFRTHLGLIHLNEEAGEIYALANENLPYLRCWASAPEALLEQYLHRAVKLGHHSVVVEADWPPLSNKIPPERYRQVAPSTTSAGRSIPRPHFSTFWNPFDSEEQKETTFLTSLAWSEKSNSFTSKSVRKGDLFAPGLPPDEGNGALYHSSYGGEEYNYEDALPFPKEGVRHFGMGSLNSPKVGLADSIKEGLEVSAEKVGLGEASSLPIRVAVKRIREQLGWGGWQKYFRPTRARRAWWAGHALLRRGINTPRPLALCEPPFRGYPYYTYLVSEWIQAQNLHLWGWRIAQLPPADRLPLAAQCAESLGRLIGRLHAHRIRHGDLNMSNILVQDAGSNLQTWLLDVDRIRIGLRCQRAYLKDLIRLAQGLQAHPWIPCTAVCRFLKAYVKEFPPFARPDWKTLWHRISKAMSRRQQK